LGEADVLKKRLLKRRSPGRVLSFRENDFYFLLDEISGYHGSEYEDHAPYSHIEVDWAIALMMEAVTNSETSVNMYEIIRCKIPEYSNLISLKCSFAK
jgi:hypothetical protein